VSRERDILTSRSVSGPWLMPSTVGVEVPARDREVLISWTRSQSIRAGLARRARSGPPRCCRRDSFTSVRELIAAIKNFHRGLERPLPAFHLDQDCREVTPALQA